MLKLNYKEERWLIMNKLKGNLTISLAGSKGTAVIKIEDRLSGVVVAEVEASKIDFYDALSGLAHVPVDLKFTSHPDRVGKKVINKNLHFKTTTSSYSNSARENYRKEAEAVIANDPLLNGFMVSDTFSSQDTVVYKDGETFVNCNIVKFEEVD